MAYHSQRHGRTARRYLSIPSRHLRPTAFAATFVRTLTSWTRHPSLLRLILPLDPQCESSVSLRQIRPFTTTRSSELLLRDAHPVHLLITGMGILPIRAERVIPLFVLSTTELPIGAGARVAMGKRTSVHNVNAQRIYS